jgi:hypothetical protein
METLRDVGPTKLQPAEIQAVRNAADTLLFAQTHEAPGAGDAVDEILSLTDHLEASGRWLQERAGRLAEDVLACGPVQPADRLAA